MNRQERRKLQKQGVQVPKDPSVNIKLSDLGRGMMTPTMEQAMMHEINQQCLEADKRYSLDLDTMSSGLYSNAMDGGKSGSMTSTWPWPKNTAVCVNFMKWMTFTRSATSSRKRALILKNGRRRCCEMTPKPWENAEGYPDPTAYNALRPIMQEDAALEGKVNFLIKVLKFIIAESGFELLARIELKDKKTGRCFR